uniref:Uncharacterized protein n=1 Tax=Arundo donax TaxID=35708 RepID=A0A0A9DE13_ARUDO
MNSLSTCFASSLVGAKTIAKGNFPGWNFSLWRIIASKMGIPKANVFPVPVLARPTISLPSIAGSRTALWMGNSLVMPFLASLSTILFEIPSLATSSPSFPAPPSAAFFSSSKNDPSSAANWGRAAAPEALVSRNPSHAGDEWNHAAAAGASGRGTAPSAAGCCWRRADASADTARRRRGAARRRTEYMAAAAGATAAAARV